MMLTSATSVERELTRRASIMSGDVGLPWKPSKRRSLKVVENPLPAKRRRSEPLRSENLVAPPISKCEEGEIQLKVEGFQGSLLENRAAMFEHYQPWVIQTYGDLAKTKTITLKKYERIVRTLGGLERNCLENSKFRFWVRAKGFRVGRPEGYQPKPADGIVGSQTVDPNVEDPPLYVPTAAIKESHEWKKVAVVENFFDIIYCVHVEMEGRPGKHAGQKRTYRTITETYGFLPREAVTKFLMGCTACQRHPRTSSPTLRITSIPPAKPTPKTVAIKPKSLSPKTPTSLQELTLKPRRVAMSKQNTRCVSPTSGRTTWKCRDAGDADDEAESVGKSERGVSPVIGRPLSPLSGTPMKLMTGIVYRDKQLVDSSNIDFSLPITTTFLKHMRSLGYSDEDALKLDVEENVQSTPERDPSEDEHYSGRNGDSLPLRLADGDASNDDVAALWGGYHHAIKKQPDQATETSSLHDETSSSGNKEDEDDEDDEADDKIDSLQFDPERLKAFNMFVRLFVDENLDRIVPISKQPKEKIQAIIDSCTRQFPEFAERARKRIRTYLKSCRRNKRSRDTGQTWEVPSTGRPTPAHLTSVAAEQILAQACENESHNAKRMRLGLEPVGQPLPLAQQQLQQQQQQMQLQHSQQMLEKQQQLQQTVERRESQYPSPLSDTKPSINALSVEQLVKTNGAVPGAGVGLGAAPTALYRPNFGQAFQRAGPTYPGPPAMFPGQQPVFNPAQLVGGDLSMKTKPLLNHKLNPTEMAAVRQLVTGYRESAAFLLRSADELEQLLLQQQP